MKLFDEIYDYLSHRNQQLTKVVKPKKKKDSNVLTKWKLKLMEKIYPKTKLLQG